MATPEGVTASQAGPAFQAPSQQRTFIVLGGGRSDLEGPVKGLTAVRNFVATEADAAGARVRDLPGLVPGRNIERARELSVRTAPAPGAVGARAGASRGTGNPSNLRHRGSPAHGTTVTGVDG